MFLLLLIFLRGVEVCPSFCDHGPQGMFYVSDQRANVRNNKNNKLPRNLVFKRSQLQCRMESDGSLA